MSGYEAKMRKRSTWRPAGDMPSRVCFEPSGLDYSEIAKLAGLPYETPKAAERFSQAESTEGFFGANLDANTIVSFTINFEPNEQEFSADRYGAEFNRALKAASTFGNARVVVRGHSDPTKTLKDFITAGMQRGLIKQTGTTGNYRYFFKEQPLDLGNIKDVMKLIEGGAVGGGKDDPMVTMQAALALSKARADKVKRHCDVRQATRRQR